MMDTEFRRYLSAIKDEEPPISSADPRWEETAALATRLIEESKVEAALRLIDQEPARKKRWDLLLLTSLLRQGLGEREPALEALEVVADKLMAAGDRPGVRHILDRFLMPEPTTAAVRILQFLARGEETDGERVELLREAIEIRPDDPELHADLSPALGRMGDAAGAREHRLRAIELNLDLGRTTLLGDELLRAAELDLEHSPARIGRVLLRFSALAPWGDVEPLLDLALPELERRAAGLLTWEDLAPVAQHAPATPAARALISRFLRVVVARLPQPDVIIEGSGIANASQPIAAIGERLPKILALPPGAHIAHTTWGLGRIVSSDGETLILEFTGRAGHKMSFAMASRSLDRLPDDGLRVLAIEDAARLRELAEAGDPEVLVRALRDVGGKATVPQLRPRLETAIPEFDWGGFWKVAKERLKTDRRLDMSEAYRQIYRLALEGIESAENVLPQLMPRAAAAGLGLIRRFLREHPEEEDRLKVHAGVFVRRWAADESLDPPTMAQALCYAMTWGTLDSEVGREIMETLISQNVSPDDLALSANQEQLLDLSIGCRGEEDFLWRAAASRLPRLRERGRARLRDLLGERYARAVEQRISRGVETPALAARLIEHFAANRADPAAPGMESLLLGTVRLLERDLPDGVPERLFTLLSDEGTIRRHFTVTTLEEGARAQIESSVLPWAGSERRLLPVLECLRAIGLTAIADAYERRRKERAHNLLQGKSVEDLETRFTIMSRRTYERLETELKRIALELRTTIPAAIETARQLGDLRENAEYDAAKARQASAATRLQELITTLERTRLLESIEIDESRVGVGTEIVLTPLDDGDQQRTYWIVGEGDGGLGAGALSYRAPLARALLGKSLGTDVGLELPDGTRRYRVESIVKRLPE